jgi:hypothetical protein
MDMRIQLLSLPYAFDKLAPEPAEADIEADLARRHRNRFRVNE